MKVIALKTENKLGVDIRPGLFLRSDEHSVGAHSRYKNDLSYLRC